MHFVLHDIVEDPNITYPQAILRSPQTSQALDSALANLPRFVPEMALYRIANLSSNMRLQRSVALTRFRSEGDLETHSGQSIAKAVMPEAFLTRGASAGCEKG